MMQQHTTTAQKTTPFAEYWKSRGINPAVIPAKIKDDYHEYYTQVNGHPERFQWSKSVPFDLNNVQCPAFSRKSFSRKKQADIPLFVSPNYNYATGNIVYLVEGLPDAFSLLTAGRAVIALKSKSAWKPAKDDLHTFFAKYPNLTHLYVIPDPDGWQGWTRNLWSLDLPVNLVFIDIRQAFTLAGVAGKDVNDLWRAVNHPGRFLDALHGAIMDVQPPTPEPPQPAKAKSSTQNPDDQRILDDLETWYTAERMAEYAVHYTQAEGMREDGNEFRILGQDGLLINKVSRKWWKAGIDGAVGIVTLASFLMFGSHKVYGADFIQMRKAIADYAGYPLPEPKHANHAPHPAGANSSTQKPDATPGPGPEPTAAAEPEPRKEAKSAIGIADKIAAELQQAGYRFTYSDLKDRVFIDGEPITDVMRDIVYCEMVNRGYKSRALIESVMSREGYACRFHPVKDYLNGLTWDNDTHIECLGQYFSDKDSVFTLYLRKWLIGAVAKAFTGAQNPMLVLVGGQGLGKGEFTRWLCPVPDLFIESPIVPDLNDHKIRLCEKWVWQVGELGATTRKADVEALKDFLTLEGTTIRRPYGHFDTRPR